MRYGQIFGYQTGIIGPNPDTSESAALILRECSLLFRSDCDHRYSVFHVVAVVCQMGLGKMVKLYDNDLFR